MEHKKNNGPFLVVVPLTTINNWMSEFERWAPSIKVITYKGSKQERKQYGQGLKVDKFNVLLTTYDFILRDKSTLNKISWQYIIVDEGHKLKNTQSKFASTLTEHYTSAHRILLTGTPLQNNLSELWSLLNFLLPKIFNSCDDFRKWFDQGLSKMHPGKSLKVKDNSPFELTEEEQLLIINRLHQVLRPFLLRRVKQEVAKELPPKTETVIKVQLSSWQKLIYKGITEQTVTSLKNTMMQLRHTVNHPFILLKT